MIRRIVRRHRAPVAAMAVSLVAAVAVSCGVPLDAEDRAVGGRIPPDLLVALPTTTSSTLLPALLPAPVTTSAGTPVPQVDYPLDLYFADGTRVVRVTRRIGIPPTPDVAVAYLVLGPREDERGLTTALVERSIVVPTVTVREGRAEVELSGEFERLTSTQQFQLFNQLIATLTALPGVGVGAVQFFRSGSPISVLRPDGQLAIGPQTRDDIAEFIQEEPPSADTTVARAT